MANLAVIILFWWSHSGVLFSNPWISGNPAIALGRVSGLLLQVTLLLQLLFIGRISSIEKTLGFDVLNKLHRWLGYSLVVFLIAHPLFLTIGYGFRSSQAPVASFVTLATSFEDVLSAVAGVLILLAVVVFSLPWVRRKLRYESWHAVHLLTYVALWLSFGHQTESGGDFANQSFFVYWYLLNGAVVGSFFLYRFVRPFALWYKHRFVVDRVVQEALDTWSVYITGRDMTSFTFEPGQFATIHLLSRGLWPGHPFSFSHEYDGSSLRFTIKALGDATKLVAGLRPGVRVLIDGPLGRFTPSRSRTKRFLLIGGGIGITPLRAIAGALTTRGEDVVVLYGVRTVEQAALVGELSTILPAMHLVLSDQVGEMPTGALQGQINASIIASVVPDAASRDVYVCGPVPMMDAVTKELHSIGVPRAQIHTERFAF